MTKDELKAKAREMGMKVRDGFMDDKLENSLILFAGVVIGWVSHSIYLWLK